MSQKETLISKSFPLRNINVCYILSNYDFDIDILFVDPISKIEKERETKRKRRERERNAPILMKKKRENFSQKSYTISFSICAAKMFRLVKALEMLFDTNASVH